MEEKENYTNTKKLRLSDGLVRQNVALLGGMLTGPVVAGAVNFESAVVISMVFTIITFMTVTLCRFISRKIVYTVRIIIYALAAGLFYIPAYILTESFMGTAAVLGAGIYLPVLITNPLILSKTETRFFHRPFKLMLPDLLGYVVGFNTVCLLTGLIRDVLVSSRIGQVHIENFGISVPALETSFGGFILIGVMSALCRAIYNKMKENKKKR